MERTMEDTKRLVFEPQQLEAAQKLQQEREKLIVQRLKLPNGATFTRLKPVVIG
jgi:hypothetical protein